MERDEVIKEIEVAFRGVGLGDGIGIFEAIAMDYCVSDKKLAKARSNDIRDDWHLIPDDVIERHYQSLCFMDEKGLRFHLPAYMTFALKNFQTSDSASIDWVIYALCKEPEVIDSDWTSFTAQQKSAIAAFLRFMITEAGEELVDAAQAALAYNKTWHVYDKSHT